jgi:4-hydroxy-tetrahydrodipicolinate synthase
VTTAPERLAPGLWVVLATPFDAGDAVDHASLRRQVDLARAAGAQGLVALGVFGEAGSLDLTEQAAVVSTVHRAAGGLPLVVGLAARATAVMLEQAHTVVEAAGGDLAGLMAQVHSPDPQVVVDHLHRLHDATGLGVVLQDYPLVSGVRVDAAQLRTVLGACPFVAAVKAESPPTPPAAAALSGGDVPVFGGLGGVGLVDELACGAAGAMTGFSHPEGLRQTLDAFARGGFAAAARAWAPWLPLANFEGQAGIGLGLRKELLRRRGVLGHAAVRPPAPAAPGALLPLLGQHLERITALDLLEAAWTPE